MKARYLFALSLCMLPTLVFAHPGHDGHGLITGVVHPWTGMDHLITMLAVGMWGVQLGGRMRWVLPLSFIGMMVIGAALGFGGVQLGAMEQAIAASLCVLGLMFSAAIRFPVVACIALTGCFAVFHGYAHATESLSSSTVSYIAGFVISTAVLHALGFGIAILLRKHQRVMRWAGVAIALSGAVMLFA